MTFNQGLAPIRHLARVTIELTAPLSIGTGRAGDIEDDLFVTDASGLPALPASTLAGLLRRAYTAHAPEQAALKDGSYFGWVQGTNGERSRLSISWGHLHDSHDRPVRALLLPDEVNTDPVLRAALQPITRDHVRLNHAGSVDGRGKFDRSSVPAGHRFTFEVELIEQAGVPPALPALLDLLRTGTVRLGGHTRSGLGTFRVEAIQHRRFDLRDAQDRHDYGAHPVALHAPAPHLTESHPVAPLGGCQEQITLVPEEPWLIGGGQAEDFPEVDREAPPNALPYKEARVAWTPTGAKVRGAFAAPDLVVPASAIKGALRHRTAFYVRVAQGQRGEPGMWAEDITELPDRLAPDLDPLAPDQLPSVQALFGTVHNSPHARGQGARAQSGRAGAVFISDGRVSKNPKLSIRSHVSLDRFSSGPMPGLLFNDAPLEGGSLTFTVQRPDPTDDNQTALDAFERALDDLCSGRLQLGAGHGKGYGWFTGTKESL